MVGLDHARSITLVLVVGMDNQALLEVASRSVIVPSRRHRRGAVGEVTVTMAVEDEELVSRSECRSGN